jgi:hypothetical protein
MVMILLKMQSKSSPKLKGSGLRLSTAFGKHRQSAEKWKRRQGKAREEGTQLHVFVIFV